MWGVPTATGLPKIAAGTHSHSTSGYRERLRKMLEGMECDEDELLERVRQAVTDARDDLDQLIEQSER